jgi:arginyl-tRNA synthetase
MSNFGGYVEEAFHANKQLMAEAHASGRTREAIVAEAMKVQPCAAAYAVTHDEWGNDWGLAMAMLALRGRRLGLFVNAVRAKHDDNWSDVIAIYGQDRVQEIRAWMAANEAYLAAGYATPKGHVTHEYNTWVAASDKVKDILHK